MENRVITAAEIKSANDCAFREEVPSSGYAIEYCCDEPFLKKGSSDELYVLRDVFDGTL